MTSPYADNKHERSDFQESSSEIYLAMNGYRSEQEEHTSNSGQICCLVEDGDRCKRPTGNASYSKRIQKTVAQKKLKLSLDINVSNKTWQNISEAVHVKPTFDLFVSHQNI